MLKRYANMPSGVIGLRRMLHRGRLKRPRPPAVLPGYMGPDFFARNRRTIITSLILITLFYGFAFGLFTTFIAVPLAMPLGIMALLVIWALPDTGGMPGKALEWWFFAFLVALMLWPNYLALVIPGLPWLTALRITGFPLLFLFVIALSTSAAFRAEIKHILATKPLIWKAIVLFAVTGLVTIVFSSKPFLSLNRFVISQINWTMIFFLSCYLFTLEGRATKFARFFMGAAIILTCLVIWEARLRYVPWANSIPSFLRVDEEMVGKVLQGGTRAATGEYRAVGVHTTPLSMAEFFALSTPFFLYFIVRSVSTIQRIALVLAFMFLVYGIFLTGSRLGWMGLLVSIVLYSMFEAFHYWRRNPKSILGPASLLAYPAFCAGLIGLTLVSRRLEMMVWGSGATQASTDSRADQIALGVPKILQAPWGHGPGMGGETLAYFTPQGEGSIDNYLLSIGLEYGIIGFVAYYGVLLYAAVTAGKAASQSKSTETGMLAPVAIALVAYVVIKTVLSQDTNNVFAFIFTGMVVALLYRLKKEQRPTSVSSPTLAEIA